MLRHTFVHVPGIGKATEKRLWKEGCTSWDELLENPSRWPVGTAGRIATQKHIEKSRNALEAEEHQFFRVGLGSQQAWRAFPEFRHSCVYLDIETDGGVSPASITTIGLYDGKEYRCLIKGQDLECFRDLISHYSMVVTFFGGAFDIPVLQKRFPGVCFDQIHIDLCPTLKQIGVRGGLKKIERELGIQRSPETIGLTGYDAVLLWRRYRMFGDERALNRLIAYNRDDCVNLERITEYAYNTLRSAVFDDAMQPDELAAASEAPV